MLFQYLHWPNNVDKPSLRHSSTLDFGCVDVIPLKEYIKVILEHSSWTKPQIKKNKIGLICKVALMVCSQEVHAQMSGPIWVSCKLILPCGFYYNAHVD
jgi:hypothetical protein